MDNRTKGSPTKLKRNRKYETFRMHAFTGDGKDSNTTLAQSVLQTYSWLRKRFAECDIPEQIRAPEPDAPKGFCINDLRSFRVDEGYIIDVIYLKDEGVWALHLTEPDMGTSLRLPVPGRTFETNVAFRAMGHTVEFGIKIVCSQPSDVEDDCEVFRPALVREISKNQMLGLRISDNYAGDALKIKNKDMLSSVRTLLMDRERHVPLVIFTEDGITESPSIPEDIQLFKSMSYSPIIPAAPPPSSLKLEISYDSLAASLTGYAFVAVIPLSYVQIWDKSIPSEFILSGKKAVLAYPVSEKSTAGFESSSFSESTIMNFRSPRSCESHPDGLQSFEAYIKSACSTYMKERADLSYGNVLFHIKAKELEYTKAEAEITREQTESSLKSRIRSLEGKISELCARNETMASSLRRNAKIDKELNNIEQCLNQIKQENADLRKKLMDIKDHATEYISIRNTFPIKIEDIPTWIKTEFSDSLYLHPRAESELSKCARRLDAAIICDALYYIACIYPAIRRGDITGNESLSLLNNPNAWEVTPVGIHTINLHKKDYSISYCRQSEKKPAQRQLDLHLKKGVSSDLLLRIYFFWDEKERKAVIGYMPDHLPT